MIDRPGDPATGAEGSGATSTAPEPAGVVSTPTPIFTPDSRRSVTVVSTTKYRAVFACGMQAGETPTT